MPRTLLPLLALLALALHLPGCPADDDDTAGDDDEITGLTIRGQIHRFDDFSTTGQGLTVIIANPTEMLLSGEDPTILGTASPEADGTFEVTGVDATDADLGLIMIIDDAGDTYLSAATGIDEADYEGWTDGFVVEDQIAFAMPATHLTAMETDMAAAGWTGSDLFGTGALLGFVQHPNLDPIASAVVSSTLFGGDVYYADGDAMGSGTFDDGSGTPNTTTTLEGDALWVAPNATPPSAWLCEADGYDFDSVLVGSTTEILVIVAFRPL